WRLHIQGNCTTSSSFHQHDKINKFTQFDHSLFRKENIKKHKEFYQQMLSMKLVLGKTFRWVNSIVEIEGESYSILLPPENTEFKTDLIPPGFIDSVFQSVALFQELSGTVTIPFSIDSIE